MELYHGTGYDIIQSGLRNTQQTSTQNGVGLTPHLHCAKNFGSRVFLIEVDVANIERQTVADHPDRHWSDEDAMVAQAIDCRIIKEIKG